MKRIQLGHSPDSDDAFMFYGLAEGKVDTDGFEYQHVLRDIQTLNDWAGEGKLECTAISVHAYSYVCDKYAILSHGASMGDGYGPMVVTREPTSVDQLRNVTIAIPGLQTSAYLALGLFLGGSFEHVVMPFDAIMEAVAAGEADAGLLIHEGQLSYANEGLHCAVDLGAWWKNENGLPLPLGVNAVRKDLTANEQARISRTLRNSIRYGLDHRDAGVKHAMQYAREMDTATADKFVGMYVNDWTLDMGEPGKRSIKLFLDRGATLGLSPAVSSLEFVD